MAMGSRSTGPKTRGPLTRWLIRLGWLAVFIFAVIGVLPTLIARTPLRGWIIARATRDLPVSVTVQDLALGWWSPVELGDVSIRDLQGQSLAQIPRIATERTLLNLVCSPKNLGTIKIERPSFEVVFAKNSSNLEQLLSEWKPAEPAEPTQPNKPGSGLKTKFSLEVNEAIIRVTDEDRKRHWQVEKIAMRLGHDPATAAPLSASITGTIVGEATPGNLDVKVESVISPSSRGQCRAKIQSLPLALFEPILRRSQPDLECKGFLQGETMAEWEMVRDGSILMRLRGQVQGDDLQASGGPLGEDRFTMKQIVVPLQLSSNGSQLQIDLTNVVCDLGKASAKAAIDWQRPLLAGLATPGNAISVDLSLAQLAQRLPKTLNLHKDVVLSAGRVVLEGKSIASQEGSVWEGKLNTTEIRGTRAGQPIAWQDPIALSFKIRQTNRALPDVEELRCQSRFLTLVGSASPVSLRIQANADLKELATPLGQFVNLGNWGIAGRADATITLMRPESNAMTLDATLNLDQFQWGPWQENRLVLRAEGQGQQKDAGTQRIEKGLFRISSGPDLLEATLREPLTLADSGNKGSLYMKFEGDLTRWQHRLMPIALLIGDLNMSGQVMGQAWVSMIPGRVDVQSLLVSAQDIKVKTSGYAIQDPNLELQASLVYSESQGLIELKDSQLRGQAVVIHTPKLRVDLNRKSAVGNVVYRGDLARLQAWFGQPVPAEAWGGVVFGQADLVASDEGFDVTMQTTIKGLTLGNPMTPRLSDPLVKLTANGKYESKADRINLEKFQISTRFGTCDAQVKVAGLGTTMDVDAQGTLAYDLAIVEPFIKSYLGANARIQGKDSRAFNLKGPLKPRGQSPGAAIELAVLQGDAGLSWQLLNAYGADVGPVDVKAHLLKGLLKVDPISTSLNQGRLSLAPTVRLDPLPRELTLPAGPFVENAKITPAMCASALGMVLPMLANVAEAEGSLSVQLDGARVPLADPNKADIRGVISLHNAKVGPGPLARELGTLLRIPSPYSVIRENQVKFKVENGRVYHENLELVFPDQFVVRTSGSVGMDGSLSMIAEMPFPTKLLGNLKLPATVTSRPIRIPVAGTVDRPRLDSKAFNDIIAQATRDAAGDVIRQGLEGQLNRILRPK